MALYEPQEDSTLLARIVREHARGCVLDVGTGTGVQAFAALENDSVTSVLAIDIEQEAIVHVEQRIATLSLQLREKITVRASDRFIQLGASTFDTIVCNPPYLPNDPAVQDIALDGGPHGYEWIEEFLAQAREHLAPGGQILFLFSSLSVKEHIDATLTRLGYAYAQLAVESLFFEQLFVYRAWVIACV